MIAIPYQYIKPYEMPVNGNFGTYRLGPYRFYTVVNTKDSSVGWMRDDEQQNIHLQYRDAKMGKLVKLSNISEWDVAKMLREILVLQTKQDIPLKDILNKYRPLLRQILGDLEVYNQQYKATKIAYQSDLSYNGNIPQLMVEKEHQKIHGKLKKFYKSIVAGSLAIPLLFNVANADCNLECNVKKDTPAQTLVEESSNNPLRIPLPKQDNFIYRHTALEETPEGTGIFVYDGYSINDPKKEKIDYMIKSRVVFELPEPSAKNENKSNVYLVPFQHMWIDKEGKPKIAIDYDGKINGNEIDITQQYKELINQFLEQQEKENNSDVITRNRKIDI